jgi:guanylate kinase|tara:strand:- start:646 stop:1125 length:480 start_codon:yes stop_codon:yes gene_type:complete
MNKVILIGKAAAGKDHMRKVLEGRGFKYGTSYTTRPPRPGEIDGQDYYFIDEATFLDWAEKKKWYEYVQFNGWYYGTTIEQFHKDCNLFVMTPHGVNAIHPIDRKKCTIIYLDIPLEIRRKRLEERGDINDKIERRIAADEKDFENFSDYDIIVNNPNF